jgi:hypothetical protein
MEDNIMMCEVEYQNCRTDVPKELGIGVSAVTKAKLFADRHYCSNDSVIAFQGVAMSDFFAVHTKTLKLANWSGRYSRSYQC